MLQFLQTGKVLYVLAAVCGLGVLSKLVTSSLYKRMMKETGNMALTKNKNLRLFRQRTENMLMLSNGIRNTNAYIEKQFYNFRFMKLSLDAWDNFSVQAMILCILIGGVAAFGAYWYRCDSYYIVLYGTMGILAGLFMVLVDNSVNISLKRQQLMDCLVDYVDNTPHFFRSVDKSVNGEGAVQRGTAATEISRFRQREQGGKTTAEASKFHLRKHGRRNLTVGNPEGRALSVDEMADKNTDIGGVGDSVLNRVANSEERAEKKTFLGLKRKKGKGEQTTGAVGVGMAETDVQEASRVLSHEEELRRSIDGLKQSLEQIAASREQTRMDAKATIPKDQERGGSGRAGSEFSQEDLKFLGELLQEYLT